MTMRELAALANVSISTVSKAFNDAEDVCFETKQHIFNIAKKHGCYGKFYKGKYSKKVIAIICSELKSNYYISFVEILQNIIEKNDGIAIISADNFDSNKQAELIDYYASYLHVDGVFVFGLMQPLKKGYDIPVVSIFSAKDKNVDSINVDFRSAIEDSVNRLYNLGHRNITFIGENRTKSKSEHFKNFCEQLGDITYDIIQSEYRFEKAGKEAIKHIIDTGSACTAIISAYDYIAIGAIKQLKNLGYKVPDDFSVIGMDNLNVTEYMDTELTSIDVGPEEICMLAWDLLQKKQKNKYYKSQQRITIKAKLIVRNSISKPKLKG